MVSSDEFVKLFIKCELFLAFLKYFFQLRFSHRNVQSFFLCMFGCSSSFHHQFSYKYFIEFLLIFFYFYKWLKTFIFLLDLSHLAGILYKLHLSHSFTFSLVCFDFSFFFHFFQSWINFSKILSSFSTSSSSCSKFNNRKWKWTCCDVCEFVGKLLHCQFQFELSLVVCCILAKLIDGSKCQNIFHTLIVLPMQIKFTFSHRGVHHCSVVDSHRYIKLEPNCDFF